MNSVANTTLQLIRLIKAPRERVFAAWTTPADLLPWFGGDNCRALHAEIDPRVGGQYLIRIKTERFGELDVTGTYREVTPPSKLVFTWNWKGNPDMVMPETLVTVEFQDKDGATEIRLTHEWLENAESRDNHTYGWSGSLDKLEKLAGGAANCPKPGQFCWNELIASDTDGAASFYTQLFGWKGEPGPGPMPYFLFKQGDQAVAGYMKRLKEHVLPNWLAYVTVESAEASAAKAAALGAHILVPTMDLPGIGKVAIFIDPQGAALGLFQPAGPSKM